MRTREVKDLPEVTQVVMGDSFDHQLYCFYNITIPFELPFPAETHEQI